MLEDSNIKLILDTSRIRNPRKSNVGYCERYASVAPAQRLRPTNEDPPAEDPQTAKQNGKNE